MRRVPAKLEQDGRVTDRRHGEHDVRREAGSTTVSALDRPLDIEDERARHGRERQVERHVQQNQQEEFAARHVRNCT